MSNIETKDKDRTIRVSLHIKRIWNSRLWCRHIVLRIIVIITNIDRLWMTEDLCDSTCIYNMPISKVTILLTIGNSLPHHCCIDLVFGNISTSSRKWKCSVTWLEDRSSGNVSYSYITLTLSNTGSNQVLSTNDGNLEIYC